MIGSLETFQLAKIAADLWFHAIFAIILYFGFYYPITKEKKKAESKLEAIKKWNKNYENSLAMLEPWPWEELSEILGMQSSTEHTTK